MQGRACREGSGVGGWGQDWGIVKDVVRREQ